MFLRFVLPIFSLKQAANLVRKKRANVLSAQILVLKGAPQSRFGLVKDCADTHRQSLVSKGDSALKKIRRIPMGITKFSRAIAHLRK